VLAPSTKACFSTSKHDGLVSVSVLGEVPPLVLDSVPEKEDSMHIAVTCLSATPGGFLEALGTFWEAS
jgi:hypothetical protein